MNSNTSNNAVRSFVALGQMYFVLAAGVHWIFLWSNDFDTPIGVWISCTLFTSHFFWALWSWHALNRHLFDCYALFFISLCSFSGGKFFLETFNLNQQGIISSSFSNQMLNQAVFLVTVSIILFHSAAMYCCLSSPKRHPILIPSAADRQYTYHYNLLNLRMLAFLFFVISLPFIIIQNIDFISLISQGGYLALFQQDVKHGIENWQSILCTFFLPGVLFFLASAPKRAPTVMVSIVLISVYTCVCLFVGGRGAASTVVLAFLLLYHNSVKRIKPVLVVCLCIGAMIIFPAIQAVRNMERNQSLSEYINVLFEQETQWYDTIAEMGNSFGTIIGTINLVPNLVPYSYGHGYCNAALRVFPNVFGIEREKTYSIWYIETVDPLQYANGGGLGFSVIAEAYANFSWCGPPIVLGLLGFFLAKFVRQTRQNPSPFKFALEAVLLTGILVLPRSEIGVCLRPFVWYCLIPYFLLQRRSSFESASCGDQICPITKLILPNEAQTKQVA